MKKQSYRDYATEAFRFWAAVGGAETYRRAVWDRAIATHQHEEGAAGISKPSEAAIIRAERAVDEARAEILDLDAVDRVMATLQAAPAGEDMIRALRTVYMAQPLRRLERGDIERRAIKAAREICCDRRTVYRYLARAREMFAAERELRRGK